MSEIFIGLMSGTSLDGVDAVVVDFSCDPMHVIGEAFVPYDADTRQQILDLQGPGHNELARSALLANRLARLYADAVAQALTTCQLPPAAVRAVVCHGQTIRHAPQDGYTLQIGNLALLAELCGIDVIGDLRSRDVAAGGQGAPLVPAFHQALFAHDAIPRVILNIGGIANLTRLSPGLPVTGFDTGPGNMLMDAWIRRHQGKDYDADGAWAASGRCQPDLLARLLDEPYFAAGLPKSTGRDLFDLPWLDRLLAACQQGQAALAAADVQATLLALSSHSIADAIHRFAGDCQQIYVCGGGARNTQLMQQLAALLPGMQLETTAALGLPPQQVEAAAFAWLGWCFTQRRAANLPAVTGACGPRPLGALYPC